MLSGLGPASTPIAMSGPASAQQPGQTSMTIQQALDIALQHHNAKNFHQAEIIYRQILAQHPTNPDALHLLGLLAHLHNRNDVALDLVSRATQLAPTVAAFWNTLGEVNRVLGRLDMAYHCYHKALRYHPDMPEALNNLGILHAYRCEIDKSIASFERAISLRADYAEAHDGLGLTLLLAGQLRRGWTEQEWRWRKDVLASVRRHFTQPMWQGGDVTGKRFLVHAEQGFGDVLQFCRYVPLLKQKHNPHLIFEVPPELAPLLQTVGGFDELVIKPGPGNAHLPPFDLHCPLMSLPLIMGTDLDSIPAEVPYLTPDPAKSATWKTRLEALGSGLKVGVGWAGRPTHPRDAGRSMQLSQFAPFAKVPGVQLISLQKGDAAAQIAKNPGIITLDVASELHDFSDSAALVSQLDLVLAVDTSLVHLAGSLAKPFFVLLPFSPDWRWLLNRSDSPWYPTGRLFRQRFDKIWDHPVQEAAAALTALVEKR
jgi:Tfp pilus assembly protein PilF